jgi:hypothetical protein
LKKQWCIGAVTGEYLARLEDVLSLYQLAYDERHPVICFDELPVQLLGDTALPLPMKKDQPKRFDYEYKRAGTAVLLVAFEPLAGQRVVEVSRRRTKADYARFLRLLAKQYPSAEKIILVQDNLNTHNASSFYENLPAEEAYFLMKRFEFHYTPKKGSWLNMAELELSALTRICLDRRIDSSEELTRQIEAIVKERNKLKIKVRWQFTVSQAREKLNRHYEEVKSKN